MEKIDLSDIRKGSIEADLAIKLNEIIEWITKHE